MVHRSVSACTALLVVLMGGVWWVGAAPAGAVAPAPVARAARTAAAPGELQPGPGQFFAIARVRIASGVQIASNATITVKVTGVAGVPATGVASVAVNVAAQGVNGTGYLIVYPSGMTAPAVNSLAYRASPSPYLHNLLVLKPGADGSIKITNKGAVTVRVYADMNGYTVAQAAAAAGGTFVGLAPSRIVNNVSVAAGGNYSLAPLGRAGIPASGVSAVVFTLIAKHGTTGNLFVYPSGGTKPSSASMAYGANVYLRNFVIAPLGADGKVIINNGGTVAVGVFVEVAGYFTTSRSTAAGATTEPLGPARQVNSVSVAANADYTFSPLGTGGVPGTGVTAVGTVFAARSTGSGALQVRPSGTAHVGTHALGYQPNLTSTGFMTAKLGADGKVTIHNSGAAAVSVWADVYAYFKAPAKPGTPAQVRASSGDGSATVTWQQPPDGGATITKYTVKASPGGQAVTTTGLTSAVVPGLSNGMAYRFTVTAANAVGTSDSSAPSDEVVPAAPRPPGTPLVTGVYARDSEVRVNWSPPETGAQGLTRYEITTSPGGQVTSAGPDKTEAVVTGLTNGTAYTFTLTAVNANGTSQPSVPGGPAVPRPADKPLKPMALLATPLDGRIDVQWVGPADGGSAITGYTVTASPGGASVAVAAGTTVASLTGLTNGTAYTLTVVARNKAGTGAAATTGPVTPAAARAPGQPTGINAGVAAQGNVQVSWTAPVDIGTAPISSYTVTASPGGRTATSTGTAAVMSGLDPAVAYAFSVTATNSHGTGPASKSSGAIKPKLTVRKTPVVLSAQAIQSLRIAHLDGTLDFEQPPAQVTALQAGDIVVAGAGDKTPRGLFRRVTEVSSEGGLFVVSTAEAALTEVVDDGAFAVSRRLNTSDIADQLALAPGVRLREPTIAGRTARQGTGRMRAQDVNVGVRDGTLVIELETNLGENDHPAGGRSAAGRIEGEFEIEPHADFSASVDALDGLRLSGEVSAKVSGTARGKFGFVRKKTWEWPLQRIRGKCYEVLVAGMPVVACVEFELKLQVEVDGSAGIAFTVQVERTLGARVAGHNTDFTTSQINEEGLRSAEIHPYGDINTKVSLPTVLTLYFYDAAGPGITLRPYLQLKADTADSPWWEVRLGARVGVFVKTQKFFGRQLSYENDHVMDWFITLASAGGPFNGLRLVPKETTVDPNEPVQFEARVEPAGRLVVPDQWRVDGGPGTIDSNGRFVSSHAGTASVYARFPGDTTAPASEAMAGVTIRGSTRPSEPLTPAARPGPLSASVSWTPPRTDGNSPITRYAVTSTPPTTTTFVSGATTSTYVRGLKPGVPYIFQVYALNNVGSSSSSVATAPVVPFETIVRIGSNTNIAVDEFGRPDSHGYAGTPPVRISGDGHYAFFGIKSPSNLAPPEISDPAAAGTYLVRKDLATGEIVVASRGLDGRTPVRLDAAFSSSCCRDLATNQSGTVVAFIVQGGTKADALVHDMEAGTTWNASAGLPATSGTVQLELSDDGQTVALEIVDRGSPRLRQHHIYRQEKGRTRLQVDTCVVDTQCDRELVQGNSR